MDGTDVLFYESEIDGLPDQWILHQMTDLMIARGAKCKHADDEIKDIALTFCRHVQTLIDEPREIERVVESRHDIMRVVHGMWHEVRFASFPHCP